MPKSLVWDQVGRTLLLVQNSQPIDPAEYASFAESIRSMSLAGVVVWAPKTAPNSEQRKLGREAMGKLPVAVLSSSTLARGVVGLFSVFVGDQIRIFPPHELEAAFAHAQVAQDDAPQVRLALERLKAVVGP